MRFVEEQRSLVSEQRDRQNAPVWRHAKWWISVTARIEKAISSPV